jgi:hypothetical protein
MKVDEGHIHVPAKPRTWARAPEHEPFSYSYDGGGHGSLRPKAKNGYSATIPYAAGILALGWQICPDLTPAQMKDLLFESAHVHDSNAQIINPAAFIELIRDKSNGQINTDQSHPAVQRSRPVTFPKIDRHPSPVEYSGGPMTSVPKVDPSSDSGEIDLRAYDLSTLDLSGSLDDLLCASFDDQTVWPPDDRMPKGFNWRHIMELGKDPSLGVRTLHARGITGKHVGIAIIDHTLLVDHQEYKSRLRFYEEPEGMAGGWLQPQVHGAAVASIAVGQTVGVAPDADLYFIAATFKDTAYIANSIRRMLEINNQLPEGRKIRVISISWGWGASTSN